MAQAKGVLPTRSDDREVLYRNPRMCGYFVGIRLAAGVSVDQIRDWLTSASTAIDTLVQRQQPREGQDQGDKVASVAVGFAPRFFDRLNSVGPVLDTPVGLRADLQPSGGLFPGMQVSDVDAMFYVCSVFETRVNEFMTAISASPLVEAVSLERGYQRSDGTEPFGYQDGVRNVRRSERSNVVFVHTDGEQPDEPAWADGGTYLVTMKIVQNMTSFQALVDDAVRDATIGRAKDGTRLDLVDARTDPHEEATEVPEGLPATSHVRKAGPRGVHDDTQIFRRGLPFLEVQAGRVQVGLQFASFQANPAQFDAVFNDWMMNQQFPPRPDGSAVGVDALFTNGITTPVSAGLFFVPPHHPEGLVAALSQPATRGKPTHGRLAIQKVVTDPGSPTRRFERGGFKFQVQDETGVPVVGSEFETVSSGRGVCPVELEIGKNYRLVELSSPHPSVTLTTTSFTMQKRNEHLQVVNTLAQPGGYGSR